MFVVSVTIFVTPDHVDEFIQATLDNARNTRQEPDNVRFDVHQAQDDPTRFLLHEVYREPDDFKAHQQTEHYLRWRETVRDWMAKPREAVKLTSLFPEDENW